MAGNRRDITGWKRLPVFPPLKNCQLPLYQHDCYGAVQWTRLVNWSGLKITFFAVHWSGSPYGPSDSCTSTVKGAQQWEQAAEEEWNSQEKCFTLKKENTRHSQEIAWSEKDTTSRNSPLVSPNATARRWCSGEKGYQDCLYLLSLLLPRAGQAKTHAWHLSRPAGGSRLGITSDDFGKSGREKALERRGWKGTGSSKLPSQHRNTQTCFTSNFAHIHENSMSRYVTTQHLKTCDEFLKLKGSLNLRVLNLTQSHLFFFFTYRIQMWTREVRKVRKSLKLAKLGIILPPGTSCCLGLQERQVTNVGIHLPSITPGHTFLLHNFFHYVVRITFLLEGCHIKARRAERD